MRWNRMALRFTLGMAFLMILFAGNVYPRSEKSTSGVVTAKKKITIFKDRAIVNGDTINLGDLKDELSRIGDLDITIIGDADSLAGEGVTEKRNEIVRFGGDVTVDENEKITGSVVVFGGTATIAGVVTEDVVVMGGDLIIEKTADIRGSAVCFGGTIDRDPDAKIGEQEVSLGKFPFGIALGPFFGDEYGIGHFMHRGVGLFAGLVCLGLLLLFGAGTIFFFPKPVDRVSRTIDGGPLKAGLVGLLGEILMFPLFLVVTLVLCVSIIGIPLLFLVIPLGVLAVLAAFFLGYVGSGVFAGHRFGERASLSPDSPYKVMVLGIILLLGFDILASIVGLTGDELWPLKTTFGVIGGIITYLAATVGFGAVIMTRFGTRSIVAAPVSAGEQKTPEGVQGTGDADTQTP
jgi:hypothetical protein